MRLERVVLIPALMVLGLAPACSGNDRTSNSGSSSAGEASVAAGTANASGGANSGGTTDALAGGGGTPAAAGSANLGGSGAGGGGTPDSATGGSTEPEAVCGNGLREPGEACDGEDLHGYVCADLGYDSGTLTCNADCTMDESDCAGSEQCSDGLDNDGDRLFDCEDDDCAEACGTSCALPEGIPDVGTIHGALVGHASELSSRCSNTGSEPEVVYTVTASRTGVLELGVFGSELKLVSVRTSCDDGSTELDCSGTGELEVPVAEGQSYFVVVEGNVSDLLGEFDLSLNVREIACGNLAREGTEGCDDGNLLDGDGCDANCQVELSEQESNRSPRRANPYVSPFFGTISSALDQDYVSFELAEPPVAIYLNIADFGDGACDSGELDSLLTLIGPDGATTIAEDDDGGVGYCSEIEYVPEAPEAGPYFAAVGASPLASSFEFPYILSIYVELCGNGITSGDEQCDDGNQDSQDGCSSTCQLEE